MFVHLWRPGVIFAILGLMPTSDVSLQDWLCEVTDQHDRPLLAMPLGAILRQRQFYRLVAVALYDGQGAIYLRRRPAWPAKGGNQRWWGLLVGAVAAGESREDAAMRELSAAALSHEISPRFVAPFQLPNWHNMNGSLYRAVLPRGIVPIGEPDEWLLVDRDEMRGLLIDLPEMVAPETAWAFAEALLFPPRPEKTAPKAAKIRRR